MRPCMVARVRSFSSISWSSENGGLADAKLHARYSHRNQRKSKASNARSFAVHDLPRLTLTGLMRTSEPNGVRIAEFSSI